MILELVKCRIYQIDKTHNISIEHSQIQCEIKEIFICAIYYASIQKSMLSSYFLSFGLSDQILN